LNKKARTTVAEIIGKKKKAGFGQQTAGLCDSFVVVCVVFIFYALLV
jgi:hypothetical protein